MVVSHMMTSYKMSKEYENSYQRLAILKQLINAHLCKADDYAMPELEEN